MRSAAVSAAAAVAGAAVPLLPASARAADVSDELHQLIDAHRLAYDALYDAPLTLAEEEYEPIYRAIDAAAKSFLNYRPMNLAEVQAKACYLLADQHWRDRYSGDELVASLLPHDEDPATTRALFVAALGRMSLDQVQQLHSEMKQLLIRSERWSDSSPDWRRVARDPKPTHVSG